MKNILIIGYNHPEGYPPTLNAIGDLSRIAEHITVIGRNAARETWVYPANCKVYYSSAYCDVWSAEKKSIFRKIKFFTDFLILMLWEGRKYSWDVVLAYDPMGLFASWLIFPFLKGKKIFWYHNHDVFEEALVRKYSVQWWAGKYEKKIFNKLAIFSLPSDERKIYFPMEDFKGRYFFIPNFPSKSFFCQFYKKKIINNEVRIIFQGAVAEGHGLEEIAGLLDRSIGKTKLHLTVKGWIRDAAFKEKLQDIARRINSIQQLEFVGYGAYKDLPPLTASCHIGIGIHSLQTNLHGTLGKASNKLYEYASLGLPIIVYDSEHYRTHLGKYAWVFFTDSSPESIMDCLRTIINNYDQLSRQAYSDFVNELNFELSFAEVMNYLKTLS